MQKGAQPSTGKVYLINCPSGGSSSPSDVLLPDDYADSLTDHSTTFGNVIPNRIFVGGLDYRVNERDLRHIFSQHGTVKEVKIVLDHSGVSRGYGFVTFETQEDALKIINNTNGVTFKDKKLSVGPAFRKHQPSSQTKSTSTVSLEPAMSQQTSYGTFYLTTSTGSPYTYHNGVAYFHCSNINTPSYQWLPPSSPMVPHAYQPVYEQLSSHHYQCMPNQYQWNTPQLLEPTVQHVYPMYPQRAEEMAPAVLQHDPGKNLKFSPSWFHHKPRHRRHIHHKEYHHLPESTEPPDTSMFHTPQMSNVG
ncbi:protein boule-like isoform X3 [Neolamprologus brichardi]|uniref:protein boule-like isoform X3 n=1 Tax=Neolamprologus brichardi TaxID=32507 RepID=UPI0003EBE320|nr:protein boule-like isoform X3 [Neolamprologus brichardi]